MIKRVTYPAVIRRAHRIMADNRDIPLDRAKWMARGELTRQRLAEKMETEQRAIPDTLHDFVDDLKSKQAGEPLRISAIERQVWITKLGTTNLAQEIAKLMKGGSPLNIVVSIEKTVSGNYFARWYHGGGSIGQHEELPPVMQDRGRGGDMEGQAKARYWQARAESMEIALREMIATGERAKTLTETAASDLFSDAIEEASAVVAMFSDEPIDTEQFESNKRQNACLRWAARVFGDDMAQSPTERALRFLEEAVELYQAVCFEQAKLEGEPASWGDYMNRADKLAELALHRMLCRPAGKPQQEVGAVMVTLASLCQRLGISIIEEWRREFNRVLSIPAAEFQRRQKVKHDEGLRGL